MFFIHQVSLRPTADCCRFLADAYTHHIYSRLDESSEVIKRQSVGFGCNSNSWLPGSWVGRSDAEGQQLYASDAAQQYVWKHQHPKDCASQKFVLYTGDNAAGHGIGSTIHLATWAMAEALAADRVFLFAPSPEGIWTQGRFCDGHDTFYNCYFEPVSSCTYADVIGNASSSEVPALRLNEQQDSLKLVSMSMGAYGDARVKLVPFALQALINESLIPPDKYFFWWRAQAVAYLLRPNRRTLKQLEVRKQRQTWSTVPAGSISVHIRHGDKSKEMELVPDRMYLEKAEELILADGKLTRTIFLSTEDAHSVKYFRRVDNWTVLTMQVPRQTELTSPSNFAQSIGPDEEMLNSLVNLDFALECYAWVGTLRSNWNRLIEELRSTVRCKAQLPYVDAHQGWRVSDYDW